jgi:hypothetical protein
MGSRAAPNPVSPSVGGALPEHHLGLLKSLALQPTRSIAVNLTPIVSALQIPGYVTFGSEG